jgi:hypothetical protein
MKTKWLVVLIALVLSTHFSFAQDEEVTLFSGNGNPVAYIDYGNDEPVIYMWSGKPVAYLSRSSSNGMSVYGFNGKHLGWFVGGVVRDHDGNGACGVKGVVSLPKLEPLKSLKELKPLKSLKELEPLRPIFSMQWSSSPCSALLFEGAD